MIWRLWQGKNIASPHFYSVGVDSCIHFSRGSSVELGKIVSWFISLSLSFTSLHRWRDAIKNNEPSFTSPCFAASQQILPLWHRVLTVPRQRFNSFFSLPPLNFYSVRKSPSCGE